MSVSYIGKASRADANLLSFAAGETGHSHYCTSDSVVNRLWTKEVPKGEFTQS